MIFQTPLPNVSQLVQLFQCLSAVTVSVALATLFYNAISLLLRSLILFYVRK